MRPLLTLALIFGFAPLARTQPATPKFEVASIRSCPPGSRSGNSPEVIGRVRRECSSLMMLIRLAYTAFANGTYDPQQVSVILPDKSPGWIDTDLYTLEAKAEEKPGQALPAQGMMLGPMTQALLQDRFKLRVHWETRPIPVYELTVGKNGPRLPPAATNACVRTVDEPGVLCGVPFLYQTGFILQSATMEQLCSALIRTGADRMIIDKTGLRGVYDVRLDWSNGDAPFVPLRLNDPATATPDRGAVTAGMQTALEQLGLRLEPTVGPGSFLVIEHFERPTEN